MKLDNSFHSYVKNGNDPWCLLPSFSQLPIGQNSKVRSVLESSDTGEYFTKIRGPPPSGKKSTCWQKLSENSWKLANFPSKIMFYPIFLTFSQLFCQNFLILAFLLHFFQKYGHLVEISPKISSAENVADPGKTEIFL